MARVRNVVLLFATLCCYASISSGDENQVREKEEIDHDQLVDFVRNLAEQVELLEDHVLSMSENNEGLVKSLSKRQASNRPASGLPMNVPVKMSGFAFGKRDGQLVRRSAQAKPVKLAGFAFGKRGPLVKRSSDDQLLEEDDTEKRDALHAFTFGKRRDPSALSSFTFGKRRDPMGLSALTFGKRGSPSGYSAFTFGKRGQMDNLHAFSFGKRGRDPSGLSAFSFGKRGRDPSALSAFSFGKRMGGMKAFTFGKREDLEEEGAFAEENDDEKRNQLSSLTGYTFGKRDTQEAAAADDNTLNQEETLRTN